MKKKSLTEIILILYVMLMPFSLFSPAKFGINIKLCDFIFPFLFLSFLIEKRNNLQSEFGKSSILYFFLIFIITGFISFFNSTDIKRSLLELTGYLYLLALSIVVVSSTENTERLHRLIKVWLFTTGVVLFISLFGVISFFINEPGWGAKFVQYSKQDKTFTFFPRIKATFYSPNMLLTHLHVSIMLGIVYFYSIVQKASVKSFKALVAFGLIIFAFLGAFFTQSRRFCGVLLSLFLILRKFSQRRLIRYLKYLIFVLFVVFLILSALATIWQIFPIRILPTENIIPQVSVNTMLSLHFLRYIVSFRMFIRHPIIGNGIGTYTQIFPNFYSPENVISKFDLDVVNAQTTVMNKTYAVDPHCAYMGVLAEQGAVGFFALISFFALLYFYIYRKQKYVEHESGKNIIYILTSGLTGFLLNGFTIDFLTMRHFWFLSALTVAALSIYKNKNA